MQAAADPCSPACLEDGSCVAVLSTDGGGKVTRFQVLSRLGPPSASGCAYVAAPLGSTSALAPGAQPHVVLKVAPAPELAVQARHLHLPLEPWIQVCEACQGGRGVPGWQGGARMAGGGAMCVQFAAQVHPAAVDGCSDSKYVFVAY